LGRRAAAFKLLRQDGFVPTELIDLVEGYNEEVPVRMMGRKEADGLKLTIKRGGKLTKSGNGMRAAEALAFFLRVMLSELKCAEKIRKSAPVRKDKLVPRSAMGTIALDLLHSCQAWNYPPGPYLTGLIRELLDLDGGVENTLPFESAALMVAQSPNMATQEIGRRLNVNPGTVSRWRRSTRFKKAVDGWTMVLRHRKTLSGRPPQGRAPLE
jgi:hypothetical protein